VDGEVLRVPIAHAEGNYYADDQTIAALEANNQIVVRYCEASGEVTPAANPNGSIGNIAGVVNEARNVVGLMPHPDRCVEEVLGNRDGIRMLEAIGKGMRK
jgi:phosphoribosylformylglycinamidine synthase